LYFESLKAVNFNYCMYINTKKLVLFWTVLSVIFSEMKTQAQTTGVVVYEQTVKMEINPAVLEGAAAQFAHLIPKERKSTNELIFNESASIYKNLPVVNESDVIDASGSRGIVRSQVANSIVYNNLKNNKKTEQREFFTRYFLIEDNHDSLKWKLTGNKKEILGYECFEAEAIQKEKEKETKVIAWFTPHIPVSTGPGNFMGLPGLALEVGANDGKLVIKAVSIDLKPVSAKTIKKPNKGKKVTPEQFRKIVEEKTAEMTGGQGGGQGGAIMIIRQ